MYVYVNILSTNHNIRIRTFSFVIIKLLKENGNIFFTTANLFVYFS